MIRDPLTVYLVVRGPLGMSPGKIASQAFQAAQRLLEEEWTLEQTMLLEDWRREGTCTVTRIAETEQVFERVRWEIEGSVMIDEGETEVLPNTATLFASLPIRRSRAPSILKHKRIPLLQAKHHACNQCWESSNDN